MAYGYQPYYQPYYQAPMPDQLAQLRAGQYQSTIPQPMQQTQQNNAQIVWVPGAQAAFEYPVAPNSAVALWDSSAPVIYLKQADASGKPTTKVYDLVERGTASPAANPPSTQSPTVEYATKEELIALAARVDAMSAPKSKKTVAKEDVE